MEILSLFYIRKKVRLRSNLSKLGQQERGKAGFIAYTG
jgi:hypothetical protein